MGRRTQSRAFAAFVASAIFLIHGEAFAQRVVLVRPKNADRVLQEAFTRIRAELELCAFEVTIVDADEERVIPEKLEEAARKGEAFASISFERRVGATAADVWIVDRVTGKTSKRSLAPASSAEAPSVLAIRTVDLLRASLREFGPAEPVPPDIKSAEVKAPEAVKEWATKAAPQPLPPPSWRAGAELAMLESGGALGATTSLLLSVTNQVASWCHLGVLGIVPLASSRWETGNGSVLVRQSMVLAEGGVGLLHGSWGRTYAALGAGYYRLDAEGVLKSPLTSTSDNVNSFVATAGLGTEVALSPAVAWTGKGALYAAAPQPGVAIGTTTRMELREPLVSISTGLSVRF